MDHFNKLRDIALPLEYCGVTHKTTNSCTQQENVLLDSLNKENKNKFKIFFEHLNDLDDNKLNNFLETVDCKNRVSATDVKTEESVAATETLVNGLLQAIGEIDPRFKTSCIYSGSFYDDLKVGQADEFDFVARIESLSQEGILEAKRSERKKGFVYLVVKDKQTIERFKEFITSPDDDECLQHGDKVLNVNRFQEHFIELVYSAIQTFDISDNFIPVDFAFNTFVTKESWQPLRHGPCATLYVTYICETTSELVNIDIDIAPSIAYPGNDFEPRVFEKLSKGLSSNQFLNSVKDISNKTEILLVPFHFDYIEQTHEKAWHYQYSNTWRVSHSSLEKAVFSLFKPLDTEKKLFRILKVLKEIYVQGSLETENKSGSGVLKLQEPPSTFLTGCTVEPISLISDEGEYDESESDTDSYESDESEDSRSNEETIQGASTMGAGNMPRTHVNLAETLDKQPVVFNYDNDDSEQVDPSDCTYKLHKPDVPAMKRKKEHDTDVVQNIEVVYDRRKYLLSKESSIRKTVSSAITSEMATVHKPSSSLQTSEMVTVNEHYRTIQTSETVSFNEPLRALEKTEMVTVGEPSGKKEHDDRRKHLLFEESSIRETCSSAFSSEMVAVDTDVVQNIEVVYDRRKYLLSKESSIRKTVSSAITSEMATVHKPSSSIQTSKMVTVNKPSSTLQSSDIVAPDEQPSTLQMSGVTSDASVINYRDSKPLIKTYFIKMLFLAMKTAFPEDRSWEPDQLSSLLKTALSMVYYAYCSEEKGILNFWFQELIENRTRDSTRVEILYCLEKVVRSLSDNIQD
ncbi:uncharacterized protein LOC128203173 [Mya arenaria]|uniref:uncharacterized protein LOC128203173 n=1 Tax=Mya arenaria TaxID=6604 RepID=UPI0022DE9DFD|nr:uncharacterized protein LOC128203173 [Mya arenaria]